MPEKIITALPVILSGPIVRRVEPKQAAIWLALKIPAVVELNVWKGIQRHDDLNNAPVVGTVAQDTIRIGENLHLVCVNLELPETNLLQWGQIYSYNITIKQANGTEEDLKALGLLDQSDIDGNSAVSYETDHLPSFVLAAPEIKNLKIIHGSCRNNDVDFEDALAWVDELVKANLDDATTRPQQLFLSGDQIYADSVTGTLLNELTKWAQVLFGDVEKIPTTWENPDTQQDLWPPDTQHFPAFIRDRLMDSEARFTSTNIHSHLISFGEFASMYLSVWSPEMWDAPQEYQSFEELINSLPEVPANYGAIYRRFLTDERSGKVEVFEDVIMNDALQFLLSDPFKTDHLKAFTSDIVSAQERENANAAFDNFLTSVDQNQLLEYKRFAKHFKDLVGPRFLKLPDAEPSEEPDNAWKRDKLKVRLELFKRGLPKVRRALANISTYMIFDDHEITDDWNLNPAWRDRVFTAPLGRTIIRNGMCTYALFQDWGNHPDKYNRTGHFFDLSTDFITDLNINQLTVALKDAFSSQGIELDNNQVTIKLLHDNEWLLENHENGDEFLIRKYKVEQGSDAEVLKVLGNSHAYLLSQIAQLFDENNNSPTETQDTIDILLGLDFRHRVTGGLGRFQLPDNRSPLIKWHYQFDGPKHKVLVIDNRTRRSYVTFDGAPGNLSFNGMKDLIPVNPDPDDDEVLFVVAPLPVLGPSVLDELIAPLAFKAFDLGAAITKGESSKTGMRGTDPDAIEAWIFDPVSQEELLKRLAPFKRIVFLSGDVHYGASQRLTYWRKGFEEPSHFAQLTSSGMRNVMPSYIQSAAQHLLFAQKMIREDLNAERMGWFKNKPKPLVFPDNKKVSVHLKQILKESSVIIPVNGWPAGTKPADERKPDWSWRIYNIVDERDEKDRPKITQLDKIPDEIKKKTIAGLRKIASRHIAQAKKINATRQILFKANIGVVTFEQEGNDQLQINHSLFSVPFEAKLSKEQEFELFTLHKISLHELEGEEKPEFKTTINNP